MDSLKKQITDEELNIVLADKMLENWYYVTKKWREKLGYHKISPYCKNFKSSRQYQDANYITFSTLSQDEFNKIDLCVDQLSLYEKSAIEREMYKRYDTRKRPKETWELALNVKYQHALDAIIVLFEKRGMFN